MYRRQELLEKLKEAAASVLPISLIVLAICFVLVPVDTGLMLSFVLATALLILGMGLFTLGAELSMTRWRSRICRCWRPTCRRSIRPS